jgi:DNA-binding NtrC family response regulator
MPRSLAERWKRHTARIAAQDARNHAEEETLLRAALESVGWYEAPAARALGIARTAFQRRMDAHPILEAERRAHERPRGRPSASDDRPNMPRQGQNATVD